MKKTLKILLIFMFLIITYNVTSKAAISATNKTVNSGDTFSVSVTSNVSVSAYTVKATGYSGLSFVTSSGGTGAGSTTISDAKASGGMTNLATFQFKAPNVENDQTFKVTFSASGMGDTNLNPVADSNCSAVITVKAKKQATTENSNAATQPESTTTQTQTKSNVATLSNLGIKGQYDFTGFTSSKTSYSVTVPNDVESVEIYASKGQNGQKISGTGVKQLQEGANAVNVVVTAEDGKTTKTYTVNIERKALEENTEEQTEETQESTTFGLKDLKVEGMELTPEFNTDTYSYIVQLTEDKSSLGLTTIATDEKASIEVNGNEDLKDGENIITIIVKDETGEKTVTYQITVNKTVSNNEKTEATVQNINNSKKKKILILVCGVIFIILIIVIIMVIKKKKDSNNGDYYQSNIEIQDNNTSELKYEEPKKKHSKGKRFK